MKVCKAKDADGIRCNNRFEPRAPWQTACSANCAERISIADNAKKAAKQAREQAKELRTAKLAIKPLGYWVNTAQDAFNKFIRARDEKEPCISCGNPNPPWTTGGQWDCGHFKSVGHAPELRFEELNAYKQCKKCNGGSSKYAKKNLSVATSYRENLIAKIGLVSVEWLEGKHDPKHYKIPDLQEIIRIYRKKLKDLKNQGRDE
jgi:hypothetical protein